MRPGNKGCLWIVFYAAMMFSCTFYADLVPSEAHAATRPNITTSNRSEQPSVIIFIGDGMGPNQIEFGRLVEYGPGGNSSILQVPNHNYVDTNNVDGTTTDSAAAATAMATGYKTHNYVIGKNAWYQSVPTIMELAEAKGYVTGIVVTSPINHATPAGFAAHNDDRNNYAQIATDMADSGIDLLLGGGSSSTYFGTQISNLQARGYAHVTDRAALAGVEALPVLGLFNQDYLTWERDRTDASTEPSLQEMVAKSITLLNASGKPFVLMVEGSQIDTACHSNDKVLLAHEVIEFEKAFKYAASFASNNSNIQLLVCADHETGGFTISGYDFSTPAPQETDSLAVKIQKRTNRANEIATHFLSTSHTSTRVYLGGIGPSTNQILNASHLVDIFQIMNASIDTITNITINTLRITSPGDMVVHESTRGKNISWIITSPNINVPTYAVFKNGSLLQGHENNSWSNNTPVIIDIDPLPPGIFNLTILASDRISVPARDSVIVTVLNDPPAISHPGPLEYEYGSTMQYLAWHVSDPSVSNGSVVIYQDGHCIYSGTWNSTDLVNITMRDLDLGIFNYTVVASDGIATSQDTSFVTVYNRNPTISIQEDVIYEKNGKGNYLSWHIMDNSIAIATFVILQDDIVIMTGNWNAMEPITICIDGLLPGKHHFMIIAIDGLGGTISDSVFVLVQDTTTSGIKEIPLDLGMISMCTGACLVVLSLVLVVFEKKSRVKMYKR